MKTKEYRQKKNISLDNQTEIKRERNMVGTCISMHLVRCECEILLMLLSVATLDWNH